MSLNPGFDCAEACELLKLCAIIEDSPIPNVPPNDWGKKPLYDSGELKPFDNRWQLWRRGKEGPFAVVICGTTKEPASIAEDLLCLMIKGSDQFNIDSLPPLAYKFAKDPLAAVHLGFAIGAYSIYDPLNLDSGILAKFLEFNVTQGADLFITGHSQGAAVGTLLRSLLHYSDLFNDSLYSIKSYLFAQPKPGNDHYAIEFENLFCIPRMAFRITNSLDWVPQAPLTLEWFQDFNIPNPLSTHKLSQTILSDPLFSDIEDARKRQFSLLEQKAQTLIQSRVPIFIQRNPEAKEISPDALMKMKFENPLVYSLNYLNAATEISLIGDPCTSNECEDEFFEHHASTYYSLLKNQFPDCKTCNPPQ